MILYRSCKISCSGKMNTNTIKTFDFDVETAGCAEALTLVSQSPRLRPKTSYEAWDRRASASGVSSTSRDPVVSWRFRSLVKYLQLSLHLPASVSHHCHSNIAKLSAPLVAAPNASYKTDKNHSAYYFLPIEYG